MLTTDNRHNYVYSWSAGEWEQISDTVHEHFYSGCGVVSAGDGSRELVVAGGGHTHQSSSEVYNFDRGSWVEGPSLPEAIDRTDSLPYADTFLLVGGESQGIKSTSIVKYDPEAREFVTLAQTLPSGRSHVGLVLVDKAAVNCL